VNLPDVPPEYLVTDEELNSMYVAQVTDNGGDFGSIMGDMLRSLLANGFSHEIAEQIVLLSLKSSLGAK
jgi:hypothetical protein